MPTQMSVRASTAAHLPEYLSDMKPAGRFISPPKTLRVVVSRPTSGVGEAERGLELGQDEHGAGVEDVLDGVASHHRDEHEHSVVYRDGKGPGSGGRLGHRSPRIEFGAGTRGGASPSGHGRQSLAAHLQIYLYAWVCVN